MKNFEIKNQNGRSMIEMLGVLAIIGVLSVGGIAGYSKAMMKYRINKTIEQITLIAGNVRTFFASQGNYDGLRSDTDTGKAIIKKAKLVPDEMWNSTGTGLENAFGGYVSIINGSSTYFISNQVSQEACIELATKDWTSVGLHALAITNSYGYTSAFNSNSCNAGYTDWHGPYAYVSCEATISLDAATQYCKDGIYFVIGFKK